MAYIWKKIMKAEGHDFILCQNRWNSADSYIIAFKENVSERTVGRLKNKTGNLLILENHGFKTTTIEKLKSRIELIEKAKSL